MSREELVNAYQAVIDDIRDAIGYDPEAHMWCIAVLRHRVDELETVWAIPDELWNAFDDKESN
jgi:hypothetical protein